MNDRIRTAIKGMNRARRALKRAVCAGDNAGYIQYNEAYSQAREDYWIEIESAKTKAKLFD